MSSSTPSAPSAIAARNPGTVFSGATRRAPLCPRMRSGDLLWLQALAGGRWTSPGAVRLDDVRIGGLERSRKPAGCTSPALMTSDCVVLWTGNQCPRQLVVQTTHQAGLFALFAGPRTPRHQATRPIG